MKSSSGKGVITSANLMVIIGVATALTLLETFGQSLLRKFYLANKNSVASHHKLLYYPLITWIIYGICVGLLYFSYTYGNLELIEVFWNTGTNTIIPLAGVLLFGENLTPYGWLGVGVTTIGGVILGLAQTGTI